MTYSVSYLQNDNFKFGLLSARFGRFLSDHMEVGFKPQLQLGGNADVTIFNLGAGLYATYNFISADAKTLPYLGLEVSGKGGQVDTGNDDTSIYTGQADLGLFAGFKYFFTERINLDVNMNYSANLYNYTQVGLTGDQVEDPDFPSTFTLNFGIGFLLSKK